MQTCVCAMRGAMIYVCVLSVRIYFQPLTVTLEVQQTYHLVQSYANYTQRIHTTVKQ